MFNTVTFTALRSADPTPSPSLWPPSQTTRRLQLKVAEITGEIDSGEQASATFPTDRNAGGKRAPEMWEFCKNRWPDLLAIVCVGIASLLTALLAS